MTEQIAGQDIIMCEVTGDGTVSEVLISLVKHAK